MIFLRGKGIVISKKDVEEADRYITIFMEDFGKITTYVKGIRKSKRRDRTAVDVISKTEFEFYRKNDNIILSNFYSVNNYENIKNDIDKINMAFYLFSVLNQILVENGKNRKLYEILEKSLDYLNESRDERKNYLLILNFLYIVIREEGIYVEDIAEIKVDEKFEKMSFLSKELLRFLFGNNLKLVITDERYTLNFVKEAIIGLEKYINFNLDTNINVQKILWGDLVW